MSDIISRDTAPSSQDVFFDSIIVNYVTVASLTCVVFEWFLTFGDELKYVWKRPKSAYISLYLIIRYYTIVALIFHVAFSISYEPFFGRVACLAWVWFHVLSGILINQTLGELLMAMRIYVVYGRNRRILLVLGGLIGLRIAVQLVWIILEFGSMDYLYYPGAPHDCGTTPPTNVWVVGLSCAVNVFVSAALCFLCTLRIRRSGTSNWREVFIIKSKIPVVRRFLRNGGVYFMAGFATEVVYTAIILGTSTKPGPLPQLVFPMAMAAYSISSTRLTLDMREPEDGQGLRGNTDEIELPSAAHFSPRTAPEGSISTELGWDCAFGESEQSKRAIRFDGV